MADLDTSDLTKKNPNRQKISRISHRGNKPRRDLCQAKVAARCMDGSADGSEDYLGRTVAGSDEDVCPGQRGEAARRGGADLGT